MKDHHTCPRIGACGETVAFQGESTPQVVYDKIREYPLPDDYRGSYDEMRQLLSHLGITDSQTLGRLNDNFMRLMNKHPTIDVFALEDYIQSRFADYDNNVSLSEFLTKHDPKNLPLWEFYCGVWEVGGL